MGTLVNALVPRPPRGGLLAALILILLSLAACQPAAAPPAASSESGGGMNRPAPDFTLTDQTGKQVQLRDLRGKVVLLNFGYTNCPDVCPIALAQLTGARRELGPLADQVQIVFVTTDPARDKPQRLAEYLPNFDKTILGLTGPYQALRPVWQAYNVRVDPGGPGSPTPSAQEWDTQIYPEIGHTAITFLIDPAGKIQNMYPSEWEGEKIAADIRERLKK